jgi:hypothetical protein
MIFTPICSAAGLMVGGWFAYKYQNEDRAFTNEELTVMSRKLANENKFLQRAKKTILSPDELQRVDPTFIPPNIPTYGEPDI